MCKIPFLGINKFELKYSTNIFVFRVFSELTLFKFILKFNESIVLSCSMVAANFFFRKKIVLEIIY